MLTVRHASQNRLISAPATALRRVAMPRSAFDALDKDGLDVEAEVSDREMSDDAWR